MAELVVPGVYIEEVPGGVQITSPVSSSACGVLGFTPQGKANKATLVTSFAEFQRIFGGFTRSSLLAQTLAAFFANGGSQAHVVRVTPSDAVTATGELRSQVTDQQIELGSGGIGPYAKTSATTPLAVYAGAAPVLATSFSLRWRGTGAAVAGERLYQRDGVTLHTLVNGTAAYEGVINPTGAPAYDAELDVVVPGTIVVSWNPDGAGARTQAITGTPTNGVLSATTAQGSVMTFDHRTRSWSILFAGTDIPNGAVIATSLTVSYNRATTTFTATAAAPVAGVSALTGSGLAGGSTLTPATGAYTFTTTAGGTPYLNARILATYQTATYALRAASPGAWGGALVGGVLQGLSLRVSGDPLGFTPATGQYTKFKAAVYLYNPATLRSDVVETYDDLVMNDSTSPQWWVDVLNELSDYITITEPSGVEAPRQLQARQQIVQLAGGAGTAGSGTVTLTLAGIPIQARTVSITYTDTAGVVRTITDNGVGGLTGAAGVLDGTYTTAYLGLAANSINYTTGVLNFRTGFLPRGGTLIQISYYLVASATTHTENLGDTAKAYSPYVAGSDGTFGSSYSRAQFTDPALAATTSGIYALNTVDDVLQIAVPDFAGDATVTADLIAYAEARAATASGGDRMILLSPPQGYTSARVRDWVQSTVSSFSKYAAVYWPWVKVADPLAEGRPLLVPPLGHIAGIYARTDARRNVASAPAGTEKGALLYSLGLETVPTDTDLVICAEGRINPIRQSRQVGRAVWGARTLSTDADFRYIQVTRLFMFVERSVYNSTWWAVFEDNGPALWTRVKLQLQAFMGGLFREGYFAGNTEAEAFSVVVDGSNNPVAVRDAGQLIVDVGFAPQKPAEFLRFRFAPRRPAA